MSDASELFRQLMDPNAPALSDAERARLKKRPKRTGHAWTPGTGPVGETCGSCVHYTLRRFAKAYRKCGLMRAQWTGGAGTDIRAGDPACKFWKAQTEGDSP